MAWPVSGARPDCCGCTPVAAIYAGRGAKFCGAGILAASERGFFNTFAVAMGIIGLI